MHHGRLRASSVPDAMECRVNSVSAIAILSRGPFPAALFACLAVFASAGAQAHSSARPADECAAQPSPADEIACLRRALKEKTDALARAQPAAPAATGPAASGRVAQPAPSRPAAPVGTKAADKPAQASRADRSAPRAAPADTANELGREQLASSRKRDDAQPAKKAAGLQSVVLSAKEDHEGLFRLTLENGQVWKQADRPSIQIALRNEQKYAVEIAQSGFGGYRMYFPDLRRTIVVKRIL